VDVIYRHVEEALDLIGVQVNGQHAVDTDHGQHVSHDFGTDCNASGTRTAVLTCIADVGDDRGDAAGRGAAEGVSHYHQFHQIIVGRSTGRLDQENVFTANIFINLGTDFAIGKFAY